MDATIGANAQQVAVGEHIRQTLVVVAQMPPATQAQLVAIATALAALYPDEGSLRRVLGVAEVETARIPFDGRASNVAWFACVEAVRQDRLAALVGVMMAEYPRDERVVGLVSRDDEEGGDGSGDRGDDDGA